MTTELRKITVKTKKAHQEVKRVQEKETTIDTRSWEYGLELARKNFNHGKW